MRSPPPDAPQSPGRVLRPQVSGCQWAKIQKRNPDVCVPEKQKSVMRDTPWGRMTHAGEGPRSPRGEQTG